VEASHDVVDEVLRAAVETGAPTGNADGGNPTGRRSWQGGMVTVVAWVFVQGLSRSRAAAIELLGNALGGRIMVSDRFSAYNHLPTQQRQLFAHWHLHQDGTIDCARLAPQLPAHSPGLCGHAGREGRAGPLAGRANSPTLLLTPPRSGKGPRFLAVPRAGLDGPSPRRADAIPAAGSLSSAAKATQH